MKKQYSKPDILFESFTLSTNIAASCEEIIDTMARGQCGISFGHSTVFVENVSGCAKKVVDGSEKHNGLCYHVPIDTKNIFNS